MGLNLTLVINFLKPSGMQLQYVSAQFYVGKLSKEDNRAREL